MTISKWALALSLLSVLAVSAVAQPTTQDSAQPRGVWDVVKDPDNVLFLTFLGANMADAKTDWKFTGPLSKHEYNLTPAQRMGIALGTSATALYLREQFPKLKRPVSVAMGVLTAYFAGRALANTYNHGVPMTEPPPPMPSIVQFRFGRR